MISKYFGSFGLILIAIGLLNINLVEGHLLGSDVMSKKVGNYDVSFLSFPVYPEPEESVLLQFSVLDSENNNVWNTEASIKIMKDGDTIFTLPKTKYEISDFYMEYTFPEKGSYEVVLEASIPNEPDLIRADFTLNVGRDINLGSSEFTLYTVIGGIAAAIVAIILLLKRRVKSTRSIGE